MVSRHLHSSLYIFYLIVNLTIIVNLVVNVSEWFLVTYIHHCTFVSDNYCEFSGECK